MKPVPVLILSDAPSAPTGLGRICRELAVRIHENLSDICRVATLGYGGPGSRKLPFPQYAIEGMGADFVVPNLPDVWADWAGKEPGCLLAIWDASRLGWFSRPNVMCENPALRGFLSNTDMQRWIYCPLDGEGPNQRLSYPYVQSLLGFDRILAYGSFGEELVRRSLGDEAAHDRDLSSIPHGIDCSVFYPRDRSSARINFYSLTGAKLLRGTHTAILDDELLIGTIATNQRRKDWGLWAEACSLFLSYHPKTHFWVHIDRLEHEWSIPQLLVDFGLVDRTVVSLHVIDDNKMAQAYSACDLTLGIGMAEGWGYPLGESLACETPVVHVHYGGGAEIVPAGLLVEPLAYRFEGEYCTLRPMVDHRVWYDTMERCLGKRIKLDSKFDWLNVWPRFEEWFRKGLNRHD